MLIQFLPAIIMFSITLIFTTFMFIPVTVFKQKNELIRFYWVGVWVFLALIASFAGGTETLKLMNFDVSNVSLVFLTALTACFVFFVMFAWFRLSYAAIHAAVSHWLKKRRST